MCYLVFISYQAFQFFHIRSQSNHHLSPLLPLLFARRSVAGRIMDSDSVEGRRWAREITRGDVIMVKGDEPTAFSLLF